MLEVLVHGKTPLKLVMSQKYTYTVTREVYHGKPNIFGVHHTLCFLVATLFLIVFSNKEKTQYTFFRSDLLIK